MTPAGAGPQGYLEGKKQLKDQMATLNMQRNGDNKFYLGNVTINGVANASPGDVQAQAEQLDRGLNDIAGKLQVLEFQAKTIRDRSMIATSDETVSVTYQLTNRTSLPSRPDTQLIQVASMPMTAEFYKLAVPVLSGYVYDQATLTNSGKMVLLAGPMASYFNGQFVGGGRSRPSRSAKTFNVGFGIDSSPSRHPRTRR